MSTAIFNSQTELPIEPTGKTIGKWIFTGLLILLGLGMFFGAYADANGNSPVSIPMGISLILGGSFPTIIALVRKVRFRWMVCINLVATVIGQVILAANPSLMLSVFLVDVVTRGVIAVSGLKQYYR